MSKTTSLTLAVIAQRFATEDAARDYLERLRWPEGPFCPHCGSLEVYRLTAKPESTKPGRKGLLKCKYCRKQFTVTVGTIFESSHIPLSKWLMTIHLLCSSKKGMSAHQVHRMLGITYRSAWFMLHRIRYAMEQPAMQAKLTGTVEVDETYVGGKRKKGEWKASGFAGKPTDHMQPVVSLVQRDGSVRSFHMRRVTEENIDEVLRDHVARESAIMTDESKIYGNVKNDFSSHETVNHHRGEYVRGKVTTNTVEGFFSLLKRGIHGVYHHIGEVHLHRYLAEFDFRYNARKVSDGERTHMAIRGFEGKRLKYRD